MNKYCQQEQNGTLDGHKFDAENQPHLKILLLTPYSPYPAHTGAAMRRLTQIQYLGERHSLVVVSFISLDKQYDLTARLKDCCSLTIAVRRRELPILYIGKGSQLINKFNSWKMKRILKKLSNLNFNIVLFDSIFMAQYFSLFPQSYRILSEHNIESTILEGTLNIYNQKKVPSSSSQKELDLFKEYENQTWMNFPLRTVVSEIDKKQLDDRCVIGETIVVRNGIDIKKINLVNCSLDAKKILFMGEMSYPPNVDAVCYFYQQILPVIWQHAPEFKFCIAGGNPALEVYDLGKDARIEIIANPEDMSKVAQECSLTVVPLRIGSGTRLKILHSMAMGLPVVSTTLGCEGLNLIDSLHISICNEPGKFAQAVIRLNSDYQFRSSLQKNARQLVEEYYDWQNIFTEFEKEMLFRYQQALRQN
ncbi:glycosyltransferase family 4 protein [Nodularia sphaerocarpa]|uniref:glycosyltransferase family 4 protein n=1 Tax=Nodularia sphaerocarpa TaxID=137816 RepID=UPI00232E865F|nr:glycosyltransferase family 4 protein [Nodularia sphaerocarpa]